MGVSYLCSEQFTDFKKLKHFRRLEGVRLDVEALRGFVAELPDQLWDPVTSQICFTHSEKDYEDKPEPHVEGCGSLTYQWSFSPYEGRELKKRKIKLVERDFSRFNEAYRGTAIHAAYEQVSAIFPVGRMRLMKLAPKKCMSWHSDTEGRLHFAIVTEPSCRMVIEDEAAHIPADGHGYVCDTRKFHTAFNGSHHCQRVHLMFGLVGDSSF